MATQSLPSTPKAASAPAPTPEGSQTPGKWRHPQLSEVVRRQNAATFGDANLRKLLWNGTAFMIIWAFGNTLKAYSRQIFDGPVLHELSALALQLFFTFNILMALYPLFRPKDDLSDIPLTPTQRALLGLDPTATPPLTPGTTYVTPPRYRLSTSRKASPVSMPSSSPLSASASFSERRVSSGTPFSPASSPLLHKAVSNGGRETGRRQSFGSSSPLARRSSFGESSMGPSTPSPLGGKRVSLGLSNKWLYERSRRLSASNGAL
ncbi:hypothetical protein NUU61_002098 [Penicillium alfredii]|uniref:Nuclear pore complex component n=1 Tax=Penicillium alfredii TaxID=1506179 RepID=A0A9W9FQV3_9EURO|nr:uncharacterized protein NUU61_002098 [Penicillium alfredii]KAJ5104751.1 hypothetical protein NUU61_002098 [Penicillium alfredii]